MAEPPSLWDPLGIWRDLAPRLEKGLERLANRGVKSDAFARGMHGALRASLIASKLRRALQDRLFEALNLPSRTDLLALGDRLQAVEDSVIGLSAALERSAGSGVPARAGLPAPPPRTRRPAPDAAVLEAVEPPPVRRRSRKARP